MAKIFITGSPDGLGRMAAQLLVAQAHVVVLQRDRVTQARLLAECQRLSGVSMPR